MATPKRQDIALNITRHEYGDAARVQTAVLQIETSKYYNGGLISDATVYWIGDHCRQTLMQMGSGGNGDYRKRLKLSTSRATQKAIDAQHAEVFTADTVAQLVEYALLHYADVMRAGVDGCQNTYPATEVTK